MTMRKTIITISKPSVEFIPNHLNLLHPDNQTIARFQPIARPLPQVLPLLNKDDVRDSNLQIQNLLPSGSLLIP